MLRKLDLADMDAAAAVHRAAFEHALPWLAGLHTPEEDRWFFRERLFATCEIWGASDGSDLLGIIAFREGWIDQLCVLPNAQRQGIGTRLLAVAQDRFARLQLWTFQRNAQARRFYESRGFALVEETDGSRNEEREPDARYVWSSLSPCSFSMGRGLEPAPAKAGGEGQTLAPACVAAPHPDPLPVKTGRGR